MIFSQSIEFEVTGSDSISFRYPYTVDVTNYTLEFYANGGEHSFPPGRLYIMLIDIDGYQLGNVCNKKPEIMSTSLFAFSDNNSQIKSEYQLYYFRYSQLLDINVIPCIILSNFLLETI